MIHLMKKLIKKILFLCGIFVTPNDAVVITKKIADHPNKIKLFWLKALKRRLFVRYGLEIDSPNIGERFVMGHPRNITINCRAIIGDDCVIFKNATIGSVRSGKRAGVPIIGNKVVVGCNAFLCGGIRIGNDVLIAANSFVDFDVPDHSLVVGNPGVVHYKENATKDYIK